MDGFSKQKQLLFLVTIVVSSLLGTQMIQLLGCKGIFRGFFKIT